MKETTNFKFKLPEDSDIVTPVPFNENFAVIDRKLKELEEGSAQIKTELADFRISEDTARLLGLDPAANPSTDDGFLATYCLAKGGKAAHYMRRKGGQGRDTHFRGYKA